LFHFFFIQKIFKVKFGVLSNLFWWKFEIKPGWPGFSLASDKFHIGQKKVRIDSSLKFYFTENNSILKLLKEEKSVENFSN